MMDGGWGWGTWLAKIPTASAMNRLLRERDRRIVIIVGGKLASIGHFWTDIAEPTHLTYVRLSLSLLSLCTRMHACCVFGEKKGLVSLR